MNATTRKQIKALEKLRLPELQARYAEVLGEETRAPNRKFLIRKITEAMQAAAGTTEPAETAPAPEEEAPETTGVETVAASDEAQDDGAGANGDETRLTKLSIPELQAKYLEVVGRDTGSSHKRYLVWKIRQAQKGRIPVGPRGRRRADGETPDFKVLPLRMEADLVTQLDEARERLGLKSRMELFRRSLHTYLDGAGEAEVAALFAPEA